MNLPRSETVLLALCLVGLLVLLVNAGLWFVYRRGGPLNTIHGIRRTARTIRHPFEKEDADLDELARRVEALKRPPESETTKEPPDHTG